MKYLIDTHVFLWWLNGDSKLKPNVVHILKNPDTLVFVSVVSAWEISLKMQTKDTIKLKTTIENCFQKSGFEILDITLSHVLQITKLKDIHKDPFDRMLIAQTICEKATLITGDAKIWKYNIPIIKT
jgi:PIN domain nuclease of toxin-antitoxin system